MKKKLTPGEQMIWAVAFVKAGGAPATSFVAAAEYAAGTVLRLRDRQKAIERLCGEESDAACLLRDMIGAPPPTERPE